MTHRDAGPATSMVYRYVPPEQVVAHAVTYIGEVLLEYSLRLTGSLTVTCPPDEADEPPENRATLRIAGATLHRIADGLFVSCAGSDEPTIRSTGGHRFTHGSTTVAGPRTRRFCGECDVSIPHGTDAVEPLIRGSLGYALDVRAVAPSDPPDAAPSGWLERHDESFAAVGAIVLEGVAPAAGHGARLVAG